MRYLTTLSYVQLPYQPGSRLDDHACHMGGDHQRAPLSTCHPCTGGPDMLPDGRILASP